MIEVILGYTGYERAEGNVKIYMEYLYRCTECETIKPTYEELKEHHCEQFTKT